MIETSTSSTCLTRTVTFQSTTSGGSTSVRFLQYMRRRVYKRLSHIESLECMERPKRIGRGKRIVIVLFSLETFLHSVSLFYYPFFHTLSDVPLLFCTS